MNATQISLKADTIARQIAQDAKVIKSQLFHSRTYKFRSTDFYDVHGSEIDAIRAEIRKEQADAERREALASKNLFTLAAWLYADPLDVEFYTAFCDLLPTRTWKNETVYNFVFTLGEIEHDVVVWKTHDKIDEIAKELPRERDFYRDLERALNVKR